MFQLVYLNFSQVGPCINSHMQNVSHANLVLEFRGQGMDTALQKSVRLVSSWTTNRRNLWNKVIAR